MTDARVPSRGRSRPLAEPAMDVTRSDTTSGITVIRTALIQRLPITSATTSAPGVAAGSHSETANAPANPIARDDRTAAFRFMHPRDAGCIVSHWRARSGDCEHEAMIWVH